METNKKNTTKKSLFYLLISYKWCTYGCGHRSSSTHVVRNGPSLAQNKFVPLCYTYGQCHSLLVHTSQTSGHWTTGFCTLLSHPLEWFDQHWCSDLHANDNPVCGFSEFLRSLAEVISCMINTVIAYSSNLRQHPCCHKKCDTNCCKDEFHFLSCSQPAGK